MPPPAPRTATLEAYTYNPDQYGQVPLFFFQLQPPGDQGTTTTTYLAGGSGESALLEDGSEGPAGGEHCDGSRIV